MTLLADLVVVLHAGFVLFAVFGGLLALRWPRAKWLHLPAVAWGAYVEFANRICPLTPLENWFRRAAGLSVYRGDFVERYLVPILYPADLTRGLQFVLATVLVAFNVAVYVLAWRGRKTDCGTTLSP